MNLADEIKNEFPKVLDEAPITDEFIEFNENLMELTEQIDHFKVVPAYMLWCLRNKDLRLVDMYTVNSLAEYGRTKMKDNDHLNFMWRCNAKQQAVVYKFLVWCLNEIPTTDTTQIQRAIKNWSV